MQWNVIIEDFNRRKIITYNIFSHGSFMNDLWDVYQTNGENKELFLDKVRSLLRYYFWSKCEWEVIVSAWPPSEMVQEQKLDVFDQIDMNWERFGEYVWNSRNELKEA